MTSSDDAVSRGVEPAVTSDAASRESVDPGSGTMSGTAAEISDSGGAPPAVPAVSSLVGGPGGPPSWLWPLIKRTLWQAVLVVALAAAAYWAFTELTNLIAIIVLAAFFGMAMEPAVSGLSKRFGWRRGLSTGVVMGGVFLAGIALVLVLIPAIASVAGEIGGSLPAWINSLQTWLEETFDLNFDQATVDDETAQEIGSDIEDWVRSAFGTVVDFAGSALGVVFDFFTMLLFTFYFAADGPKLRRALLRRVHPQYQERLGWAWDTAIQQTGAYFYVRVLLMVINGAGFFFTMVLVGVPAGLALGLAVFAGFVAAFIPTIGTYIGSAVPILVTLALQGLTAALILLGYALVYQAIENYWLSPKLSAKTMSINAAVAFGAAIAGGALFGPVGMFIALPGAGLITSFIRHYAHLYPIVYKPGSNATAVALNADTDAALKADTD